MSEPTDSPAVADAAHGDSRWPAAVARTVVVLVALLAVSALVIEQSDSAFSATTDDTGNHLSTGTVSLTDNDSGSALFNTSAMIPNQSAQSCIEVTYTGSITPASAIRLYGSYVDGPDANSTADSALAPYLDLTVQIGGTASTCASFTGATTIFSTTVPGASAGTLNVFTTNHAAWASGLSTSWTPAGGANEKRAFRITAVVRDDNNAQAATAEPAFKWEARSA